MKKICLMWGILWLVSISCAWADLATGLRAYAHHDYAKALENLRPEAEKGLPRAQNILGVLYLDGKGVDKDETEALHWFTLAANRGYAVAQTNLGLLYEGGLRGESDLVQARHWYEMAADQGDLRARAFLQHLDLEARVNANEQDVDSRLRDMHQRLQDTNASLQRVQHALNESQRREQQARATLAEAQSKQPAPAVVTVSAPAPAKVVPAALPDKHAEDVFDSSDAPSLLPSSFLYLLLIFLIVFAITIKESNRYLLHKRRQSNHILQDKIEQFAATGHVPMTILYASSEAYLLGLYIVEWCFALGIYLMLFAERTGLSALRWKVGGGLVLGSALYVFYMIWRLASPAKCLEISHAGIIESREGKGLIPWAAIRAACVQQDDQLVLDLHPAPSLMLAESHEKVSLLANSRLTLSLNLRRIVEDPIHVLALINRVITTPQTYSRPGVAWSWPR